MPVERKTLLGEPRSAVREAVRNSKTGSAHAATPCRFRTCTATARTKKSRPRRGQVVNSGQRLQCFPFEVSDLFIGRGWPTKSREGL